MKDPITLCIYVGSQEDFELTAGNIGAVIANNELITLEIDDNLMSHDELFGRDNQLKCFLDNLLEDRLFLPQSIRTKMTSNQTVEGYIEYISAAYVVVTHGEQEYIFIGGQGHNIYNQIAEEYSEIKFTRNFRRLNTQDDSVSSTVEGNPATPQPDINESSSCQSFNVGEHRR